MLNREQTLELVGEWLDSVCQSPSGDLSLRIEKQAYGRDEAGTVREVSFTIKTENIVGGAKLQMVTQLVTAPGLVIPR